jgi:hypothetical protein
LTFFALVDATREGIEMQSQKHPKSSNTMDFLDIHRPILPCIETPCEKAATHHIQSVQLDWMKRA